MKTTLDQLPTRNKDGCVHVVVESPRGSRLKIEFDPKLKAFAVSRPLPFGDELSVRLGFIPSTRAADGDPVDALVLNDVPTHPGVVIACHPIGMVKLLQTEPGAATEINNRVVLLPEWRDAHLEEASDLPGQVRDHIENFFVSAAKFTDKQVHIKGWASAKRALRFIESHRTKKR